MPGTEAWSVGAWWARPRAGRPGWSAPRAGAGGGREPPTQGVLYLLQTLPK